MRVFQIILLAASFSISISVPGESRLGEFESGFQKKSSSSSPSANPSTRSSSSSPSSWCSYDEDDPEWEEWFDDFMADLLLALIVGGGRSSFYGAEIRDDGDPILPVFRLDVGYMWVDEDVGAWMTGGEAGYGPFALEGRWTGFREEVGSETRTLDFSQLHVLYRMGSHEGFELGLGLGAAWLHGEETERSLSATVPVRYWLKERWGLEFRPAWTEFGDVGLSDMELSFLYNRKHLNASVGYRWIKSDADVRDLSGFRVGLGYRF